MTTPDNELPGYAEPYSTPAELAQVDNSPVEVDKPDEELPMALAADAVTSVLFEETQRLFEGDEPETPASTETAAPASTDYDFIPEAYRPRQFKNSDEELQFYRGKYAEVFKQFESEEFQSGLLEKYRTVLASESESFEEFRKHWDGFRTNPEEYIRLHLPEYHQALGLPQVPSEEDIALQISDYMSQEFGNEWENLVASPLALRVGTPEYRARRAHDQKERELFAQQEQAEQLHKARKEEILQQISARQVAQPSAPQGPTPDEVERLKAEQYEFVKDIMPTRAEFDKWLDENKDRKFTAKDIYRAVNFEKLLEEATAKAKEEGKREALNSVKKASRVSAEAEDVTDSGEEEVGFASEFPW